MRNHLSFARSLLKTVNELKMHYVVLGETFESEEKESSSLTDFLFKLPNKLGKQTLFMIE